MGPVHEILYASFLRSIFLPLLRRKLVYQKNTLISQENLKFRGLHRTDKITDFSFKFQCGFCNSSSFFKISIEMQFEKVFSSGTVDFFRQFDLRLSPYYQTLLCLGCDFHGFSGCFASYKVVSLYFITASQKVCILNSEMKLCVDE